VAAIDANRLALCKAPTPGTIRETIADEAVERMVTGGGAGSEPPGRTSAPIAAMGRSYKGGNFIATGAAAAGCSTASWR